MDKKNKYRDKSSFKELWADVRWRAIIKLGIWFAFFFIVFIFLCIASLFNKNDYVKKDNNEQKQEVLEKVEANIPNLLQRLETSNYTFLYRIVNYGNNYSYTGVKDDDGISGYFENSNGIIKYEIKNSIYYRVENDELIEDDSIISEEDEKILDLNNLVILIREYEDEKQAVIIEDTYTYDFSYENITYIVNITKSERNIFKIEINYNGINYLLEYKNIIEK